MSVNGMVNGWSSGGGSSWKGCRGWASTRMWSKGLMVTSLWISLMTIDWIRWCEDGCKCNGKVGAIISIEVCETLSRCDYRGYIVKVGVL